MACVLRNAGAAHARNTKRVWFVVGMNTDYIEISIYSYAGNGVLHDERACRRKHEPEDKGVAWSAEVIAPLGAKII